MNWNRNRKRNLDLNMGLNLDLDLDFILEEEEDVFFGIFLGSFRVCLGFWGVFWGFWRVRGAGLEPEPDFGLWIEYGSGSGSQSVRMGKKIKKIMCMPPFYMREVEKRSKKWKGK